MNDHEMQELVKQVFEAIMWERDEFEAFASLDGIPGVKDVRTFEEASLMTWDKGIVVEMADGSEFQITIRQSVRGETPDDFVEDEEYIVSESLTYEELGYR